VCKTRYRTSFFAANFQQTIKLLKCKSRSYWILKTSNLNQKPSKKFPQKNNFQNEISPNHSGCFKIFHNISPFKNVLSTFEDEKKSLKIFVKNGS